MNQPIKRILLITLLSSWSLQVNAECHERDGSGDEVVGALLGAALGGLLGSQIGGGSGNKIAIGAGVVAGGLLGNKISRSMDCRDRDYHYDTTQSALEYKQTGGTAAWRNPDSGHSGSVTPTRTFMAADGKPCREFTQSVYVDGQAEDITGTACREPDGAWRIIDP